MIETEISYLLKEVGRISSILDKTCNDGKYLETEIKAMKGQLAELELRIKILENA